MSVQIAINGFGRIGRLVARAAMARDDIEIVAVNDLGNSVRGAHLLKHDSIHGTLDHEIQVQGDYIQAGSKKIRYLSESNPAQLPWNELGAEIIIEATGAFRSREQAALHLQAGAVKVIITAPGKDADMTLVMGVNQSDYRPRHQIISNASCTTNCLAPVAKVLLEHFGIKKGLMLTVHSYTNDQRLLDLDHTDLRRARAAAMSIIPTTTGAASAIGLVLPQLKGKLEGLAMRVPTPNVSLLDLTAELEKETSAADINRAFQQAAEEGLKGILKYTEEPLVSIDYNGDRHSAVVDGPLTHVVGGNLAKVIAWYDNEWAYSLRVVDTILYIAQQGW